MDHSGGERDAKASGARPHNPQFPINDLTRAPFVTWRAPVRSLKSTQRKQRLTQPLARHVHLTSKE